jgi:hypothetical protein
MFPTEAAKTNETHFMPNKYFPLSLTISEIIKGERTRQNSYSMRTFPKLFVTAVKRGFAL